MTARTLRTIRKKYGLTQFALAKASKVSRYNIALFETNVRKLKPDELNRINSVLKKKEASHVTNT